MGYCFQLIGYDVSGTVLEVFEYCGSWGNRTIESYLYDLRHNCEMLGKPLPDGTMYIIGDTYRLDIASNISECLKHLHANLDNKNVSWLQEDNNNRGFLKETLAVFQKAVKAKGYVELSMN